MVCKSDLCCYTDSLIVGLVESMPSWNRSQGGTPAMDYLVRHYQADRELSWNARSADVMLRNLGGRPLKGGFQAQLEPGYAPREILEKQSAGAGRNESKNCLKEIGAFKEQHPPLNNHYPIR